MIITLKTNRLQIREYRTGDVQSYCDLLLDCNVNKFLGSWIPRNTEAAITLFKNDVIAQQNEEVRLKYILAIEMFTTGELIGNVGFLINENNIAEIGWIFNEKNWGQGFATEATKSVISYAFENNIVNSFIATCKLANNQSERIMNKVGFSFLRKADNRVYYILNK